MTSVRTRENSFKVSLSTFPKRPTFEELHVFVYQTLGLRLEQVLRLQMNHAQNCVHVKCVDLKTAQDTVIQHDGRHELEVNKKKYKVRLQMDDGGVEVKIHDLSENVTKDEMIAALQQFGDVLNTKELSWNENFVGKGTASGVWVVKMNLRRHIKSFITIQGEQTLVTYRNQPQTCRHCMHLSHPGSTCVENKKLLGQKVDLESRLKRAQAPNNPGSSASTSTPPASFAAVLNSESPLAPTSSFVRLSSGIPTSISTSPCNTITTLTTTTPSVGDVCERDHEMDPSGLEGTTTIESTAVQQQEEATGNRSTQQLKKDKVSGNDQQSNGSTTSSGDVSTFKTPAAPTQSQTPLKLSQTPSTSQQSLSMMISESESTDSENNPYHTVKRGRGRSKKQQTNSPHL